MTDVVGRRRTPSFMLLAAPLVTARRVRRAAPRRFRLSAFLTQALVEETPNGWSVSCGIVTEFVPRDVDGVRNCPCGSPWQVDECSREFVSGTCPSCQLLMVEVSDPIAR
jgi:hypothetical protein